VGDGSDPLWASLQRQAVAGVREVDIPARPAQGEQSGQPARRASLAVRFAPVMIPLPRNDPRFTYPLSVWAVYLAETDAPPGIEPIEWMLLTSETV